MQKSSFLSGGLMGIIMLFVICTSLFGCSSDEDAPITPPSFNFKTMAQFNHYLDSICAIEDVQARELLTDSLLNYLKRNKIEPFAINDSVTFLYNGDATTVYWAGDFSGWDHLPAYEGQKVGLSTIWRVIVNFPPDSRLDYKIVVNNNWILDPLNSYKQASGFGNNSELRMPLYQPPTTTEQRLGINYGVLETKKTIESVNMGYTVAYRVYTPYGYNDLSNLPVIYVTDGQEYAANTQGAMINVLDNMIYDKLINPVVAVFIDPRNVTTSDNRRMTEYNCNSNFAKFVAEELVPAVESSYKVSTLRADRAILGTSMGGLNSAYFGSQITSVFKLIAIQSPAFWYNTSVFIPYETGAKMDLKIFMTTGTIHDTQAEALRMKNALEAKGYEYRYIEVNEGHSWGNWKALLDDMLLYYFAK